MLEILSTLSADGRLEHDSYCEHRIVEWQEGAVRKLVGIVREKLFDASFAATKLENPEDSYRCISTGYFGCTMHGREYNHWNKVIPQVHPIYTEDNTRACIEMTTCDCDPSILVITFKLVPRAGVLLGKAKGRENNIFPVDFASFKIARCNYTVDRLWVSGMKGIVEAMGLETVELRE